MLGGGVFVTQNKTLPGSYINFVNASRATANVGDRGVVAIPLALNKNPGKVIEVNRAEFVAKSAELIGVESTSAEAAPLREIFKHANKVYVYDCGDYCTVADTIAAFEPYEFNVLCAYTDASEDVASYITAVKSWRDDMGKKCQVVVYSTTNADHEGVINVVSTVSNEDAPAYALVAWVAGAEAGCAINESCTNKLYDGEYTIITNKSQTQLEQCIKDGQIAFHLVYGEVRLLEDLNTLTTTTLEKGEDFKSNQTIRVIDQIANDIAKLFNTKYLGKIPNNASGRISLWGDIVKHHKELERLQAIENFDATALTVAQGDTKKSVVVNDVVTVVNAMAQLYMTVVVQ
jgi:hypothetical protein